MNYLKPIRFHLHMDIKLPCLRAPSPYKLLPGEFATPKHIPYLNWPTIWILHYPTSTNHFWIMIKTTSTFNLKIPATEGFQTATWDTNDTFLTNNFDVTLHSSNRRWHKNIQHLDYIADLPTPIYSVRSITSI